MNEPLYICPKEKSCTFKHGCDHDFPHQARLECGDPQSFCPPCVEFKDVVWVYEEEGIDEA